MSWNIQASRKDKLSPSNFTELMEVLGKPSNVITITPPATGRLEARMLKWNEGGDPTLIVTHHIIENTWDLDFIGRSLWEPGLDIRLSHVGLDILNNCIAQNAEFIMERMSHGRAKGSQAKDGELRGAARRSANARK